MPDSVPMESSKVSRLLFSSFFCPLTLGLWTYCFYYASLVLTDIKQGPELRNPKDRWLAKGAGIAVDTLTSASLELSNSEQSISSSGQCDLICSYNWVNKKRPAVYVPGQVSRPGISFAR